MKYPKFFDWDAETEGSVWIDMVVSYGNLSAGFAYFR